MKKILIVILFLLLAFYVANATEEAIVINYNKKIPQIAGLTLGVRPYQNITKLDIQILSHSYNRREILESSQEKMRKEDPFVYYKYLFTGYRARYAELRQVVDEKSKIVERIILILDLKYEIDKYGSLEEACLAIIEAINQQSGIYFEKDIDYKIIDEFIQLRNGIWIKGIDNSIIYELLSSKEDNKNKYYLVVSLFKNTEK